MWYLKGEILDSMEIQGGYNAVVEQQVKDICLERGLNYDNLSITATQGQHNYGTKLELALEYRYNANGYFDFIVIPIRDSGYITSELVIR